MITILFLRRGKKANTVKIRPSSKLGLYFSLLCVEEEEVRRIIAHLHKVSQMGLFYTFILVYLLPNYASQLTIFG